MTGRHFFSCWMLFLKVFWTISTPQKSIRILSTYILIFGLVFKTKNSKIIWNKHILDSQKKNFASADNHLYIKSLHLWSQLMYWKKNNIPCCYSNQGSWMSLYLQNGMLSRRWDRWTGKQKWWQWLLAQTY